MILFPSKRQTRVLLSSLLLMLALSGISHAGSAPPPLCPPVGGWSNPTTGSQIPSAELIENMAKKPVVLLGETHTSAEHHRWQLQVISALYGRNPNMAIGFEAFPRSVQPVLDQWSRGELTEKEFLKNSHWFEIWRFDPGLYMPMFNFARMNRIPMVALNVAQSLTHRIGKEGWAALSADQREGLGNPAKPSSAYLKSLKIVFGSHAESDNNATDEQRETVFRRFVDVQLTWDRAMAEALATTRTGDRKPLVIGIVGRGHVEYGYGIPHQLDDLGVGGSAVLLPSDSGVPCYAEPEKQAVADALFGISAPAKPDEPPSPLLGVQIENIDTAEKKAVRIIKVIDDSTAAAAGLQDGDLIVRAAGQEITKTSELVATVHRQAPGTWLPLVIERQNERLNIVAKFPASITNDH